MYCTSQLHIRRKRHAMWVGTPKSISMQAWDMAFTAKAIRKFE